MNIAAKHEIMREKADLEVSEYEPMRTVSSKSGNARCVETAVRSAIDDSLRELSISWINFNLDIAGEQEEDLREDLASATGLTSPHRETNFNFNLL